MKNIKTNTFALCTMLAMIICCTGTITVAGKMESELEKTFHPYLNAWLGKGYHIYKKGIYTREPSGYLTYKDNNIAMDAYKTGPQSSVTYGELFEGIGAIQTDNTWKIGGSMDINIYMQKISAEGSYSKSSSSSSSEYKSSYNGLSQVTTSYTLPVNPDIDTIVTADAIEHTCQAIDNAFKEKVDNEDVGILTKLKNDLAAAEAADEATEKTAESDEKKSETYKVSKKFYDNYGTHFISQVDIGAIASLNATVTISKDQDSSGTNLSVNAAGNFGTATVTVGVSGGFEKQNAMAQTTESAGVSILQESYPSDVASTLGLAQKIADVTTAVNTSLADGKASLSDAIASNSEKINTISDKLKLDAWEIPEADRAELNIDAAFDKKCTTEVDPLFTDIKNKFDSLMSAAHIDLNKKITKTNDELSQAFGTLSQNDDLDSSIKSYANKAKEEEGSSKKTYGTYVPSNASASYTPVYIGYKVYQELPEGGAPENLTTEKLEAIRAYYISDDLRAEYKRRLADFESSHEDIIPFLESATTWAQTEKDKDDYLPVTAFTEASATRTFLKRPDTPATNTTPAIENGGFDSMSKLISEVTDAQYQTHNETYTAAKNWYNKQVSDLTIGLDLSDENKVQTKNIRKSSLLTSPAVTYMPSFSEEGAPLSYEITPWRDLVPDLLPYEDVYSAGMDSLAVATNSIFENYNLAKYIDLCMGYNLANEETLDLELIEYAQNLLSVIKTEDKLNQIKVAWNNIVDSAARTDYKSEEERSTVIEEKTKKFILLSVELETAREKIKGSDFVKAYEKLTDDNALNEIGYRIILKQDDGDNQYLATTTFFPRYNMMDGKNKLLKDNEKAISGFSLYNAGTSLLTKESLKNETSKAKSSIGSTMVFNVMPRIDNSGKIDGFFFPLDEAYAKDQDYVYNKDKLIGYWDIKDATHQKKVDLINVEDEGDKYKYSTSDLYSNGFSLKADSWNRDRVCHIVYNQRAIKGQNQAIFEGEKYCGSDLATVKKVKQDGKKDTWKKIGCDEIILIPAGNTTYPSDSDLYFKWFWQNPFPNPSAGIVFE